MRQRYLSDNFSGNEISLSELSDLHVSCGFEGWTVLALERLLATPGANCLVAQGITPTDKSVGSKTQITGFLLFQVVIDEAEILTLGVRCNSRRNGIAGAMLKKVIYDADHRDLTWFLEVAENNVSARKLYERRGFLEAGHRANYYSAHDEGSDALVLRYKAR